MVGKKSKGLTAVLRRSQRGDTIVSVLLSIAVITLVIVLAYTLVSQSLRRGHAAREREQIKNLIQSQIEGLKNLAVRQGTGDTLNIFDDEYVNGKLFCLKDDGTMHNYGTDNSGVITNDSPQPYPLLDVRNCDTFELPLDKLWIEYKPKDAAGNDQHLFTVTAEWYSTNGQKSNLSVPVRIHPLNQSGP